MEIGIADKTFTCNAVFTEQGMIGRACEEQPSILRLATPELFTVDSMEPAFSIKITRGDVVLFERSVERMEEVVDDQCTYHQCATDEFVFSIDDDLQ